MDSRVQDAVHEANVQIDAHGDRLKQPKPPRTKESCRQQVFAARLCRLYLAYASKVRIASKLAKALSTSSQDAPCRSLWHGDEKKSQCEASEDQEGPDRPTPGR